jgi:hypothetical protein
LRIAPGHAALHEKVREFARVVPYVIGKLKTQLRYNRARHVKLKNLFILEVEAY